MAKDDLNRPLITGRSPSYARARRELRNPTPTTAPEVIAILNRLVEAEHNAAAVCAAAGAIARDPGLGKALADVGTSHQARIAILAQSVADLGGAIPRDDECTTVLTRNSDDIRYLQSDAEVLAAIAAIENEVAAQYDRALAHPEVPDAARKVVDQHRADQRKHQAHIATLVRGETRF